MHWCWQIVQLRGSCLSTCAPYPALQLNSKQQPPVNPIELRWSYLNVEGVWPEVLRRYIMSRAGPSAPRLLVSEAVQDACQRLGQQSVTSLSADEHLVLLRWAPGQPSIQCCPVGFLACLYVTEERSNPMNKAQCCMEAPTLNRAGRGCGLSHPHPRHNLYTGQAHMFNELRQAAVSQACAGNCNLVSVQVHVR